MGTAVGVATARGATGTVPGSGPLPCADAAPASRHPHSSMATPLHDRRTRPPAAGGRPRASARSADSCINTTMTQTKQTERYLL